MKTYILTLDDTQEQAVRELAKSLKIQLELVSDLNEDKALSVAMEEGKKYGRLSKSKGKNFLDGLGK